MPIFHFAADDGEFQYDIPIKAVEKLKFLSNAMLYYDNVLQVSGNASDFMNWLDDFTHNTVTIEDFKEGLEFFGYDYPSYVSETALVHKNPVLIKNMDMLKEYLDLCRIPKISLLTSFYDKIDFYGIYTNNIDLEIIHSPQDAKYPIVVHYFRDIAQCKGIPIILIADDTMNVNYFLYHQRRWLLNAT